MSKIRESLAYLLLRYPHPNEMSNARATKTLYLADWRHVLTHGRQITEISWFFDNYGPFVHDVRNVAEKEPRLFRVSAGANYFGLPKNLIEVVDKSYCPTLDDSERNAIDHVINLTSRLPWADFIRLVYSTHPVASSSRYSVLNLVDKAEDYRRQMGQTETPSEPLRWTATAPLGSDTSNSSLKST